MSEWRQKGVVQDSDEEEDESQVESQHSKQEIRSNERVERVLDAGDGPSTSKIAVEEGQKDAGSSIGALEEVSGGYSASHTPTRHTSPQRPTPSPFTPFTRFAHQEQDQYSSDPLQSSPNPSKRPRGLASTSQPERSTPQRSSPDEMQLRPHPEISSQNLSENTRTAPKVLPGANVQNLNAVTILGEFGITAFSDDEDELNQGQRSDAESTLSDYPSDLSDTESRPVMLYATPHRRTAVQVVIPSSTALQQQLADEEARKRQFRQRKPIQLYPYALEGERYRREVQSRGLKPVPRERSPQRRQGQNDAEIQGEEFNPFRDYSSSPVEAEIFVSTPVPLQSREDIHRGSLASRHRPESSRRSSSNNQLRHPKSVKRRRMNESLTQTLATPTRTFASSPVPRDIWSVPPDSPPYSSSPPLNPQLGKLLASGNANSLPTPSNSSTFQDEPQPLLDSDSDPVPRGVQQSGELRRPANIVLSDDPSSDSDTSSKSGQVDGDLQKVGKKIRGVLPASWLRIDRQAQERRQALARRQARMNATLSPEPAQPQRGVAQRIFRPGARHAEFFNPIVVPPGIVEISDDSDEDFERSIHRQPHDVQSSLVDTSSLAAIFDDRYAASDDDLASMEHDRLQVPTLGGSGAKRKRQPKITNAFGNTKRPKSSAGPPKSTRFSESTFGATREKKQSGSRRSRRSQPSALSVLDVELPPDVPQFLKLARRAARRDVHQGRQSPHRKQIRLYTAQDTEDANALLQQWQQGLLKPMGRVTTDPKPSTRQPLVDTADNRQKTLSPNNLTKNNNEDVGIAQTSMRPKTKPRLDTALHMLQRPSTVASKPPQAKVIRAIGAAERVVRRGPLSRTAQLEGDENKFCRNHRKFAFQKGLLRVNQQVGNQQNLEQPFVNPQLTRYLDYDDDVPPPLPMAKNIGESLDEPPRKSSPTKTESLPRKRLVRKSQAKRIDVDARQYRQPSEPTFEPLILASAPIPINDAPIEQQGDVLQGLGPFGTRYPTTFDITPLKSDTYFHLKTFIGSEDLRRALSIGKCGDRNLDDHAGYCMVSHGSTTIRCGPWNDEIYSRIYDLMTTIWGSPINSQDPSMPAPLHNDALVSVPTVLRALGAYVTGHLSFLDPIDRMGFATKMQQLLHFVLDRVSMEHINTSGLSSSPEQALGINRVLSYLLVLCTQVHQIAQHPMVTSIERIKILDIIKQTSRLIVKDIIRRTSELYNFHDKNKLHKEREGGIQASNTLAEGVVVCIHTLELVNAPSFGFWDLVSQELASHISSTKHVQVFENAWATLFSLLPFNEFDLSGVPDRSRISSFNGDDWSCIRALLNQILGSYTCTFAQCGASVNDYVRANLTRCYVLINDWHWKRPEQALNAIFDFFGKHGLKPLRRETAAGSASFLQNFCAANYSSLAINETSFHVALKCLVTGLQGMNYAYPEKKIRSFVFRRIPNHGRTYPKEQPLEEGSLAALRNHHDVLSVLYCAVSPSCRPKLERIRDLVSHETSHREACRVNVRAWANLTAFQLSMDEPYEAAKPFALWYKGIMHQTLKQYRLAKTEAEEYLKLGLLDGTKEVSAIMVQQTMERNQEQVIATLRDSIAGMKKAVECARDQVNLANFLTDSDFVQLLELPHLEDRRLLSVIRDVLVVLRVYATRQKAHVRHQVSQPYSEESQDYGDFPDLDDLDDVEWSQQTQTETVSPSSPLDFVQAPLWHLMSNAFGAERPPDDNLLKECIDTWVLVASNQITTSGKQWSYYMDSFSQLSWQQLRQTEQTRKFGPYFMASVIACDPAAFEEHRPEFLTSLLLCLADRESLLKFQHQLLGAVLRTDEVHPMLRNLPFFKSAAGTLDITAETLLSRRLVLISSLLSNMREDVNATSVQEPARTPEVKRMYAAMLKAFMSRLKSNYQQLQQGATVIGSYVEFVQKIVQFLKQYTSDICPVLQFFTDSLAFPLPSTDPTYVVGRLCGYALKAHDSGTAKQLSVFIQTVAQQAAADDQQVYLVNQLKNALCTDEAPLADRVALRTVLLQGVFPAYIEEAFSSRTSYLIARPILQCMPAVLDDMIFELRLGQPDTLSTSIHSIVSIAHAIIRGTEQLKGDNLISQQSRILSGLAQMFKMSTSISRLVDYIVGRTVTITGHDKPPIITYLEKFSWYIAHMAEGTMVDDLPFYQGDAHAEASDKTYADIMAFCKKDLITCLEANWCEDQGFIWFGQGRAKKEVVLDVGPVEIEKFELMDTIHEFQGTLRELFWDGPQRTEHVDDEIIV